MSSIFKLDSSLEKSSFVLTDWPLSRILLKNTIHFPWLILVPRKNDTTELWQLDPSDRYALIDEISRVSLIMQAYFKPDKLNVGTLGNQVAQLHIHIVARFITDPLWPFSVWQDSDFTDDPYINPLPLIKDLQNKLK